MEEWEKDLVPTEWTDKDYDILANTEILKQLGFKPVDELEI